MRKLKLVLVMVIGMVTLSSCSDSMEVDECDCTQYVYKLKTVSNGGLPSLRYELTNEVKVPCQDETNWTSGYTKYEIKCK